jgi:hypothetical protein
MPSAQESAMALNLFLKARAAVGSVIGFGSAAHKNERRKNNSRPFTREQS